MRISVGDLRGRSNGHHGHKPELNGNGAAPAPTKFELPPLPEREDLAGLCAWLTAAFNLDPQRPVKGVTIGGLRGSAGFAVVLRVDAPDLRFQPISQINSPIKLIDALTWQLEPTDGIVPAYRGEHCRLVGAAIRILAGATERISDAEEADGIVSTLTSAAIAVEGLTTYGTSGQRYEAARALRRDLDTGVPHYLVDSSTGELVVGAGDLQEAARRYTGSSLPRGWVDSHMSALGWTRIELGGYGLPGRPGRRGPHARINAYRGHRVGLGRDEDVNT